jgi:hypothetical protein
MVPPFHHEYKYRVASLASLFGVTVNDKRLEPIFQWRTAQVFLLLSR